MTTHLRLPPERIEQLRQIADAEAKTVPEVIDDLIRLKIAAGVIPDAVPFVTLTKGDATLNLDAPDFAASLPVGQVPVLVEQLRSALKAGQPKRLADLAATVGALTGIKVERMGSGVRLVSPITGKRYPLAPGVTSDLADQIEREAMK